MNPSVFPLVTLICLQLVSVGLGDEQYRSRDTNHVIYVRRPTLSRYESRHRNNDYNRYDNNYNTRYNDDYYRYGRGDYGENYRVTRPGGYVHQGDRYSGYSRTYGR